MSDAGDPRRRAVQESGAWAFSRGRSYESNPYAAEQKDLHLWWSEGYNGARAAKALREAEQ